MMILCVVNNLTINEGYRGFIPQKQVKTTLTASNHTAVQLTKKSYTNFKHYLTTSQATVWLTADARWRRKETNYVDIKMFWYAWM